eukprot:1084837-Prymnesium_polylepis.1
MRKALPRKQGEAGALILPNVVGAGTGCLICVYSTARGAGPWPRRPRRESAVTGACASLTRVPRPRATCRKPRWLRSEEK